MRQRGYRGWMTTSVVAIVLTVVFLAAHLHVTGQHAPHGHAVPRRSSVEELLAAKSSHGIYLDVDPSLAQTSIGRIHHQQLSLSRTTNSGDARQVSHLLRRPPEPATEVVLFAPVVESEFTELPLHSNRRGITYLMDSIDQAFATPTRTVSVQSATAQLPSGDVERKTNAPPPTDLRDKLPMPVALQHEIATLQSILALALPTRSKEFYVQTPRQSSMEAPSLNAVGRIPRGLASLEGQRQVQAWAERSQESLRKIVEDLGLTHPESSASLQELATLASEARHLAAQLTDFKLAAQVMQLAYSIQKRAEVWQTIRMDLDGSEIGLSNARTPSVARTSLLSSISDVEDMLTRVQDGEAWNQYLLLAELRSWVTSTDDDWNPEADLPNTILERINASDLSNVQRQFLSADEFQQLANQLTAWGHGPFDIRELLADVEELERDSISRISTQIAEKVQVLSLAEDQGQQAIGELINTHYRNANLRLSVNADLIQEFLPDGEYEIRPIRKRILGADTRGTSAVQTELQLKLIPDPNAWHVDLQVLGNLYSNTRASKGPAVFHSSSKADVDTHRFLRLDPQGYQISSQPASVRSQDYLRKMSTDYDGFPIIGDFVRLIAQQQFNQKRGLAQRLTKRIIAQETDIELDRKLNEAVREAETKLENRIIGPLQSLQLDPKVISMSTSDSRLTIRYRVANSRQLAAFTARPRAPTDSLLSMQIHESAINNAIARLGLSGKTWHMPDLARHLGKILMQPDWKAPEEVSDVLIRFADTRPITVEMQDGRLRLTLRIAELSQPSRGLEIRQFLVSSNYIPVAEGLDATLVRDGVVEIISSRRRDRVPLRFIFAKIFVSHPEIPLISEQWQADERAGDLAVSQLDIRNGWLAVAIANSNSQQAAEVAAKARALKTR